MINLNKNLYYKGVISKVMITVYILLIVTSFLIIPLIILIFLYIGYSRQIKIDKSGNVSIPGNIFNAKMPKNVYTYILPAKSSAPVPISSSTPGIAFYFDISNISNLYIVQNLTEKDKLRNRDKRAPSTMFVSDVNKTVGIEFKTPLNFLNGFGKIKDISSGHSKIYVSIANPSKFVNDVKELIQL